MNKIANKQVICDVLLRKQKMIRILLFYAVILEALHHNEFANTHLINLLSWSS